MEQSEELNLHVDIDSTELISGTSSNFLFEIPHLAGYSKISVYGVTMNKSYYNCPKTSNTFDINGNTITLTPKNYSIKTMASTLQTILNTLGTLGVWAITYDLERAILIFATTHPTLITMTFHKDFIISRMIGCPIITSFTANYESEHVTDYSRTTVIYVSSDIAISGNPKDVIYTIHPVGQTYTQISSLNSDVTAMKMKFKQNQSVFNFIVYDDNFNILDLMGNEIVITLVLFR